MKFKKLFIIALIFILIYMVFVVKNIFFSINNHPEKSDVVIVLSGDLGRLEKGFELYDAGYSDFIMLSRSTDDSFKVEFKNIPLASDDECIINEPDATSTITTAYNTLALMNRNGFKSAIVVSSNYHMSRVKLSFERAYKDSDIDLSYVTAKSQSTNTDKGMYRYVIKTLKEPLYYIGYYLKLYDKIDL